MKKTKKIERFLTDLALAPFSSIEHRERKRKLQERLNRLQTKQKTIPNYNTESKTTKLIL